MNLRLYTQPNCQYCDKMKRILDESDLKYGVIDIQEDENSKMYLKMMGHRTVPQLYLFDHCLNPDNDTNSFTASKLFDRIDTYLLSANTEHVVKFIKEQEIVAV